jgi:hypothetical protein
MYKYKGYVCALTIWRWSVMYFSCQIRCNVNDQFLPFTIPNCRWNSIHSQKLMKYIIFIFATDHELVWKSLVRTFLPRLPALVKWTKCWSRIWPIAVITNVVTVSFIASITTFIFFWRCGNFRTHQLPPTSSKAVNVSMGGGVSHNQYQQHRRSVKPMKFPDVVILQCQHIHEGELVKTVKC